MPVNIHGKEYFTVAERLNQLNENTDGNYTLTTEMIYFEGDIVVFKTTIQIEENTFTGHAMEKEGTSAINKGSYVEVCETSSIGRALASAGYLGTEFASADEMTVALKNQDNQDPKLASDKQINYIKKLAEDWAHLSNVTADTLEFDHGGAITEVFFDELTIEEASKIIESCQ